MEGVHQKMCIWGHQKCLRARELWIGSANFSNLPTKHLKPRRHFLDSGEILDGKSKLQGLDLADPGGVPPHI